MQFLSTITHNPDDEGHSHVCEAKTPLEAAKQFIALLNYDDPLIFRGTKRNTSIVVFKDYAKNRADALKKIEADEIPYTVIEHTPLLKALMNKTFYLPIHCYQR